MGPSLGTKGTSDSDEATDWPAELVTVDVAVC